jgi:TRAP-type C4-dicarboxylate transport system substrate-binding protein
MALLARCAVVLTVIGALACLDAPQAHARELRISHQWAAGHDARDQAARVFAAEVANRLPDLSITIHSSSALGLRPEEQYDAMRDGRIEMAIFPLFYLSPRIAELSITLMPGLPASADQAQLLKGSAFHRQLQALAEKHGFHILTWWWLDGGMVATEPIDGPLSVKGLKVRSGDPIFDRMFESLGADTVLMPSPRIAAALRRGELHVALASLESLISLGIVAESKHAVVGGHALYVSLHPLMISAAVWKSFTAAQQQAIEDAATIAETAFTKSQVDVEVNALVALHQAGSTVRRMPLEEYQEWLEVANKTSWQTYRDVSPEASELLNTMLRSFIESKGRVK